MTLCSDDVWRSDDFGRSVRLGIETSTFDSWLVSAPGIPEAEEQIADSFR